MSLFAMSIRSLRKQLRQSRFFSRLYYAFGLDALPVLLQFPSYRRSQDKAIDKYASEDQLNKKKAIKRDMRKCYYQIKANPSEYFLMGLDTMSRKERAEFLTDKYMYMTMGKLIPRRVHDEEIENKVNFYKLAKDFFGRKVCCVECDADYDAFKHLALDVHDLIVKPNFAAMGSGIFAVSIDNEADARKVFEKIREGRGKWIIEERIKQSKEMGALNESSCNTVRYLSFLNKSGFFAITPFLRTGRKGSVVDNAGAGGIFANVDVKTGVVYTNGIDELGNEYECHPDSGIRFKGWQIPRYDEVVATVRKMHQELMPSHPYIGWDMALTEKGWVVIECNWGQFINQYADHIGRKKEFLRYVYGK